jgi:hypothetical protein
MDQLPTRIHLGKATRQIAKSLIRLPQSERFSLAQESSLLLSTKEINAISAELYWFRLTALQLAFLLHMQYHQYDLNRYEARYMMTTAIELAFQDADLSRKDTTKIRSKLSEELDYYFNQLELDHLSGKGIDTSAIMHVFARRTLAICHPLQAGSDTDRQYVLVQEATIIWDKVTTEVEELLKRITIIEFEK